MLAKLFGTPDFTPDDIAALEYSVAMFWTIPNFGLQDWKELKRWMERAGKSPAAQRVGGSRILMILNRERAFNGMIARSYFEAQRLPLRGGVRTHQ